MPITRVSTDLCRAACALLVLLAAGARADEAAAPAERISERVESAVVKIFSTMRYPDVGRPWAKQPPSEVTGSGVVIDGHRILTNAHVVLYAGQVQVQANQEGDKFPAHVVSVAPGIDLAVLQLDDETFFERHAPLERARSLPDIKESVLAYGFPVGGSSLSITKGIVSRIEFAPYNATASGLRIQIDAAINPGNSGGPATVGDRMIGLAFSQLGGAQNIGYIIPNEEIDLFLQDVADGHYDGKPALHDDVQTLENPVLRAFLKIAPSVHGVIVHHPASADPAYPLREWDIITRVAGTPVDDQGMILLDRRLRVGLGYAVQRAARDGAVTLTIVRAGHEREVKVPAPTERPLLIPDLNGQYPSYFIYGPVVFTRASSAYLLALARNAETLAGLSFMRSPLVTLRGEDRSAEREELVLIPAPLFPHALSNGYSNPSGSVLYAVNGVRIRSLRHLVETLRDLTDEFVTFEMDNRGGEGMVFRRADIVAATDGILSDNGVRAQGSPDMMAVWEAAAHKVAAAPGPAAKP